LKNGNATARDAWNPVTGRTLFLRGTTDKWIASESAQSTGSKPSRATSSRSQSNRDGLGKAPFWQQAYTNLVKFIILLHKVAYSTTFLFNPTNPSAKARSVHRG
jgi:hypothetical protein